MLPNYRYLYSFMGNLGNLGIASPLLCSSDMDNVLISSRHQYDDLDDCLLRISWMKKILVTH